MAKAINNAIMHCAPLGKEEQSSVLPAVMRRWKFVLTCGLVGAVSAFALCQALPTRYTSSVTLMLNPAGQQRGTTDTGPSSLLPPSEETVRKNEMALIRSRALAEQVIEDLGLEHDPEFNPALRTPSAIKIALHQIFESVGQHLSLGESSGGSTPQPTAAAVRGMIVDAFLKRLDVTSTDASRIVEIRFSASSPEKAARISRTVANRARAWTVNSLVIDTKAASQSLEAALAGVNVKIRNAQEHIEEILQEHDSVAAADLQVLGQNIANLSIQIGSAAGERAAAEARLAELQSAQAAGHAATMPAVLSSLLIQRLQAEAAEISARLAGQASLYDGKSGKTTELRAALQAVRSQIDLEITRIAASYEIDAAVAKAKEAALLNALDQQKQKLAEARAAAVNVKLYEREVDVYQTLLNGLAARLTTEQGRMDSVPQAGQVISGPTLPRVPSFPPRIPMIAAGFMLFGTVGGGLALFLERRDNGIRSVAQLRDISSAKVLGIIPTTGNALAIRRTPPTGLVMTEPTSTFADSLRALWLRLEYGKPQTAKSVLITSSVAGEGKSALIASLARMLASSGRSVVVVDADLRASKVHSMLGLRRVPGLADFLEGSTSLDNALVRDEASSAYVIPAGVSAKSPVELLSSMTMLQLLNDLTARFSFVLIDSPPILAVPDAGVLARLADTTVVAVRWASTSNLTFSAALRHLEDLDVNVHGLVLTMVDPYQYGQYDYIHGEVYTGRRGS